MFIVQDSVPYQCPGRFRRRRRVDARPQRVERKEKGPTHNAGHRGTRHAVENIVRIMMCSLEGFVRHEIHRPTGCFQDKVGGEPDEPDTSCVMEGLPKGHIGGCCLLVCFGHQQGRCDEGENGAGGGASDGNVLKRIVVSVGGGMLLK